MIRLYSNEGTFDLSVDLDWVTSRIALGGWVGSAAAMADLKRQGITDILNLSAVQVGAEKRNHVQKVFIASSLNRVRLQL